MKEPKPLRQLAHELLSALLRGSAGPEEIEECLAYRAGEADLERFEILEAIARRVREDGTLRPAELRLLAHLV